MKRHKCYKCKAKRLEKFMKCDKNLINNYFKSERFVWECADDFCGHALDKMYGLPKPLFINIQEDSGHPRGLK